MIAKLRLAAFKVAAVIFGVLLGSAAQAGDKVLYAPAPTWIKPAPPIDPGKITDASPVLLLFDNQQKLQDGQTWIYIETAARASSNDVLRALGTVTYPWAPSHGDLIVHRVEIIRGTQHIDLLNGKQPFEVLRREAQMEQSILTGQLSATMSVEGLQIGDILHIAVSITSRDTALKGHVQSAATLMRLPFRVDFARTRLIWPLATPLKVKSYAGPPLPEPIVAQGMRELIIPMPIAKDDEFPDDAPLRFKHLPFLEASDFADWGDVSATMAPLYQTDGLIDPHGPIAAEVAKIAAGTTDPVMRAAAALRLVQDRIRYQAVTLNAGNLVPQTPAETWSLRYGDCKAKTLLLLAMLHMMQIDSEAVLANSQLGGLITTRLPSVAAFDHVFVKATVKGETLWLDGTASGTRLADIHDVPPLGAVLPLRAAGASPIVLPNLAPARPASVTEINLDSSAGLRLPAPFHLSLTVHGEGAQVLRAVTAQGSKDDVDQYIGSVVQNSVQEATVVSHTETFDDEAGTATIIVSGVTYPSWPVVDGQLRYDLYSPASIANFSPDRARPLWQNIPVTTGIAYHRSTALNIRLPLGGKGSQIDGDPPLDVTTAGRHIVRTAALNGDIASVSSVHMATGEEIPVAALADQRKLSATLANKTLRVVAPDDYPGVWAEIQQARALKKIDPLTAALTKLIADKPDQGDRYDQRARLYELIYDRPKAIDDLTKTIALAPDADTYLRRMALYRDLRQLPKALADANKALELDPKSSNAVSSIANIEAEMGDSATALALLQDHIAVGGDNLVDYVIDKAELLANAGQVDAAIALLTDTMAKKPNNTGLLNMRCWVKATRNQALDTALKDCTKSIELSESSEAALDSRAVVYFRMNRLDDALADLNAALLIDPRLAPSIFMRAVVRSMMGDKAGAAADLAAARGMAPTVEDDYKRYGIAL